MKPSAPPKPPNDMPAAQRRYWTATVDSFPSDWFRPSDFPLLTELCRALCTADLLAGLIDAAKDLENLEKLLALRDREARRAAALSTKLRIPPQSRSDRHLAGAAAAKSHGRRPWLDDPSERFFDGAAK
jgi:hypothetical protein